MSIPIEIFCAVVLAVGVGGLFLGAVLRSAGCELKEQELMREVVSISNDLQLIHGLKKKYVVLWMFGSKNYSFIEVDNFFDTYLKLKNGSMYSYSSLSGYAMPPMELVEQIRAKESNIELAKKPIVTN